MQKYIPIALLLILTVLLVGAGCSDRGTNVPDTPTEYAVDRWQISPLLNHAFSPPSADTTYSPQLLMQIRNENDIQEIAAYIPQIAMPAPLGEAKKVPLLVLLPPQDGDKYFYFDHGLLQIAQELTEEGLIQPMVIACLGNDRVFGGYFFGNSYPAGFYDDIIADTSEYGLVAYLNSRTSATIDSPSKRGIGGIGMGAYGAFRAVLKHPGTYTSVAVGDGPLDFDGGFNGNQGLIDLFDDALAEQGLGPGNFKSFDSSSVWPISRLFIGGALAFSPNDTACTYNIQFGIRRIVTILTRDQIPDSTTLIEDVVKTDMNDWDFHLPFDGSGAVYEGPYNIWDRWMANDLESLLGDAGAGALDNVNMWIGTSPQAKWGYHEMTESWVRTLQNNSYQPEVYRYNGYDGKPATDNQYVYDLIKQMLIFHSNNFGD
ncbi:MAG: hypothetical protein PVF49_09910 [Anaerolineales bacterium]|jgi:hypothetical protein